MPGEARDKSNIFAFMNFAGYYDYREYPGMGKVRYLLRPRARNIRITVKPPGEVEVALPAPGMLQQAETFLLARQDWVTKKLDHIRSQQMRKTVFTPDTYFSTRSHKFRMIPEKRQDIMTRVGHGKIEVYYPFEMNAEDEYLQDICRKAVAQALTIEAREHLPRRTLQLAGEHGFRVNKVSVRNNKTRWGSCSDKGNINLNVHLMRLPDDLIDHIILHELVHLVHRNHGKEFHALLEKLSPGHRAKEKRMKQYNTQVF